MHSVTFFHTKKNYAEIPADVLILILQYQTLNQIFFVSYNLSHKIRAIISNNIFRLNTGELFLDLSTMIKETALNGNFQLAFQKASSLLKKGWAPNVQVFIPHTLKKEAARVVVLAGSHLKKLKFHCLGTAVSNPAQLQDILTACPNIEELELVGTTCDYTGRSLATTKLKSIMCSNYDVNSLLRLSPELHTIKLDSRCSTGRLYSLSYPLRIKHIEMPSKYVSYVLHLKELESLKLCGIFYEPRHINALGGAKFTSLSHFELIGGLEDPLSKEAVAFVKVLKNLMIIAPQLTSLVLSDIVVQGMDDALAVVLGASQMEHLKLVNCYLDDYGMQQVCKYLSSPSCKLKTLDVSGDKQQFGGDSVELLIKALQVNQTVTSLRMEKCASVTLKHVKMIAELLQKHNQTLMHVELLGAVPRNARDAITMFLRQRRLNHHQLE